MFNNDKQNDRVEGLSDMVNSDDLPKPDSHSRISNTGDARNKKNGILYVVLVGLGFIAVLLVIAIVIINTNKVSTNSEEEEEIVLTAPECIELEDFVKIGQCIQKIYYTDLDDDALINNYRMAIAKLIENENYETAVEVISDRSLFLVSIGRCDRAIDELNDNGDCGFDDDSLFRIYNDAVGIGISCKDENTINKYNGLLKNMAFKEE